MPVLATSKGPAPRRAAWRTAVVATLAVLCASRAGAEPAAPPPGPALYRALARQEAARLGLPGDIADAVMAIESGYDPTRIGDVGEVGLMQVRPATAAMLGFTGSAAELAQPEVNIRYGVLYLAGAWRRAKGDLCRALMKYRAGHGEETMTPRSIDYCGRARAHLAGLGSAFATGAEAAAVELSGPREPGGRTPPRGRVAVLARRSDRIRMINAAIEARRGDGSARCRAANEALDRAGRNYAAARRTAVAACALRIAASR